MIVLILILLLPRVYVVLTVTVIEVFIAIRLVVEIAKEVRVVWEVRAVVATVAATGLRINYRKLSVPRSFLERKRRVMKEERRKMKMKM